MAALSNLDLLCRVPIFSSLTPAQMARLGSSVQKLRVKRGDVIVEQGKTSNSLFVILIGRARVVMTDERGKEVILASLGPGDYVGELSLIDGYAHSANVIAETQADLLMLGRAEFQSCLEDNRAISIAVIQGLAKRLRKADEQIRSLALMDVYDRVASVLENAATTEVTEAGPVRVLRGKLHRQDIAKMVGATRETVSRVMKDFEESGFLQTRQDGSIVLADRRSRRSPTA
ncbi:Crp/Fnr family transcriptional regulator [Candidatus Symbiobacter mobilis]|nr:Crp/Fnr family transcriptional regulator [Candidatus Symbiobacter mobilis]